MHKTRNVVIITNKWLLSSFQA